MHNKQNTVSKSGTNEIDEAYFLIFRELIANTNAFYQWLSTHQEFVMLDLLSWLKRMSIVALFIIKIPWYCVYFSQWIKYKRYW